MTTTVAEIRRIHIERMAEIEKLSRKALDCLWHASEAIAQRSAAQFNFEMRETRTQLDRIIELSSPRGMP